MFVVCGEALMDVYAEGDTRTGMRLDARVGGSPFNVAVGLARLGQPVALLAAIGTGFLGERLVRALRDEGVDTGCVQRVDAPTTLGLVGLDAAGVPSYAFYGEGAADRQLDGRALDALPAACAVLQFGSYAMVVPPVAGVQRRLVDAEHGRRLIAYDPNVRLNVEPSLPRWIDALEWMLPRTHLLKISEEDAGLLFPGVALEALARGWLARGVRLVVATRGSRGARAWSAGGAVADVAAAASSVVDTVGAGDSFQAALLAALAERGCTAADGLATVDATTLTEVLGFAARAAAVTCSRRGADLPRRAEV
jgi:fructokinase